MDYFCHRLLVLIALSLGGYLEAFGQRVFSLDDCVRIALQQSLNIRTVNNAIYSAQLAHDEVGRSALPQMKVEGKAMNAPNSDHFGYDPAVTDGGQFSAQVGVQELLFDGGARSLRGDQVTVDIDRLSIEQRRIKRDLKYRVTITFLDVLQEQSEMTLEQQRVDELANYLELVNRLFHGGGVNYTDVLKTQVSVENARVTLQKAVQAYVVAKISLAETMNMPDDTAFTITGAIETTDSVAVDSLLQHVLIDSVSNLDLQIANFAVRRSLFDVDIARTERLPSISLSGDVGILSSGDNLRLPPDQRVSTFGYSVGISIENLLFNWGMTDLRVQQRQLDAENVRLSYEQQRRAFIADAGRLRTQIRSVVDQLHSLNRTLSVAEDNYTLTKAQYAGGGTTALEVLSAEQLLAETRLTELQTRADLQRLMAKVEQLYTH